MKYSAIILFALMLAPLQAISQNYPDMSKMGINQMDMQKLQQMQSCMENIDQQQLQAIEQQQARFDAEIKSLCATGKRDEAQQKAIAYAKQMMNNPAIKAMQKCGEIARGMMPDMPFTNINEDMDSQHVCDAY